MSELLFELPLRSAQARPEAVSISHRGRTTDYATVAQQMRQFASALMGLGIGKLDRIGVYLGKQPETVVAMFGASLAGTVFVPVNSLLKAPQVAHILRDCNVRVLVTSPERASAVATELTECPDLQHLVIVGSGQISGALPSKVSVHRWDELLSGDTARSGHRVIDADVVSIFYTSGSTGKPKGVVLSHKNMVTGAQSVCQYLQNTPDDRLLAVLPFSFDYGFSQLSTAFNVGASVILMDYLLPRDVMVQAGRERATGLAGVPPLWSQLADLEWPEAARYSLRYITNSGGAMPGATLRKLRAALPKTQPFLMYGLTEAFRSTYLPPAELDRRPESIGKAIPNAEILVVGPDGKPVAPGESGELVHRGALVSLGYWNDQEKTAERFKPAPDQNAALVMPEMAVWSGDFVRIDADGFLYFVGRRDEMIKTSGYRVSPTEVEEVVFATGLVGDAAAVGVSHPTLGQAIVIVATAAQGKAAQTAALLDICRQQLPLFMVPQHVEWRDELPRNPNGKYDRSKLATELKHLFVRPPESA